MATKKAQDAKKPASAVFDSGRRGNPKSGCDCVQCFGYCLRVTHETLPLAGDTLFGKREKQE